MRDKSRRPGLAKTRSLPLVRRRTVELWQSVDYRWRELFEVADVMSEGAAKDDADGRTYYGSTSILLTDVSHGGRIPDQDADTVLGLLAGDPHARLRAVRVACLEAQIRSTGVLERVSAELVVRRDPRGVRVDVEVEARVVAEASSRRGRRA